ncbi:hypothetical protein DSCO28_37080 [Desulfosarcina ovata subsp. sediminis]|uniref:Uncharacterized protein n=1 Tax=Desulfosarcina ovata subsp. sediminis TaxID=885957 RepID=A0A5K7ZSG0_9BACT|nr:hypothetical protein DSCO28_37080 [Desulfosarcina ovata subsp. sediminis]
MVFGSFAPTVAVLIRNRYPGFKLNGSFADSLSVPAKDSFRKALAAIAKKLDDLSHKDTAFTPPKELGCVFPYSKILYIIVLLLLLKMPGW